MVRVRIFQPLTKSLDSILLIGGATHAVRMLDATLFVGSVSGPRGTVEMLTNMTEPTVEHRLKES